MSKSRKSNKYSRRDTFVIAKRSLPVNSHLPRSVLTDPRQLNLPFTEIEDRRTYYPGKIRPAASISKPRYRVVAKDRPLKSSNYRSPFKLSSGTRAVLAFANPKRVLVCVRRKIRKEVLHAFKIAGSGGLKRSRRSQFSSISCRG